VPDDALNWLMYEGLMQYTPDLTPELLLAEEVSSNADGSEWIVRVKPDVMFPTRTRLSMSPACRGKGVR